MAGRPKHRARVAAALAEGREPPTLKRTRTAKPHTAERKRLHTLVGTSAGFRAKRCTHVYETTGNGCVHMAVWGLDRCVMHGGLDDEAHAELRTRLGKMVEYIDPKFLLVRGEQILHANLSMIIDDAGHFKPVSEWPPEVWSAIRSVKVLNWNADPSDGKTEEVVEIKLVDQARYQELMMKWAGQLLEKLELSGTVTHEQQIGQVFVDALREGLERGAALEAERRALPSPPTCARCGKQCVHCGKSLADPPAPPSTVKSH